MKAQPRDLPGNTPLVGETPSRILTEDGGPHTVAGCTLPQMIVHTVLP